MKFASEIKYYGCFLSALAVKDTHSGTEDVTLSGVGTKQEFGILDSLVSTGPHNASWGDVSTGNLVLSDVECVIPESGGEVQLSAGGNR